MKSSSRFFCDRSNNGSYINKQAKRCVNIPRYKKGTHKHKSKCGLSVPAKQLHTPGETAAGKQDNR